MYMISQNNTVTQQYTQILQKYHIRTTILTLNLYIQPKRCLSTQYDNTINVTPEQLYTLQVNICHRESSRF